MTTHAQAIEPHRKAVLVSEGDYWRATCPGCDWRSDLAETKTDARDDHTEHVTMVLVEFNRKQRS
jgi:hypothetical protein